MWLTLKAKGTAVSICGALGALFLVVFLGLPSCTDSSTSNPVPQPPPVNSVSVDGVIGPEGGTVAHPTGARIVVPAGALAAPAHLTLAGIAAPQSEVLGGTALGQGFAAGPEGQVFLKPVDVIVPFDPTRLPAGASVKDAQLRIAAHGSNEFIALQSIVDLSARTIKASTIHFTDFIPAVNPNPVFITTAPTLPDGTAGVAYEEQLAATGGSAPYAWSVSAGSGLPPGLALGGNGSLSGTPTIPTAFSFFVTAADTANHRVQMAFALTVNPQSNPVPVLTQISPTSAPQGSAATAITLQGTGFVPSSQAQWDGTPLPTTFVGTAQLAASIPASALVNAGTHQVSVASPTPGG